MRTLGGAAGRSTRLAAWRRMTSTTRSITFRTTARASARSRAPAAGGMRAASLESSLLSTRAGVQDTEASAARPPDRRVAVSVGITRPWATRFTAARETRPSQRTLAPTPSLSPAGPAPTVTSQPRASASSIDRAAALAPDGSGTERCGLHPWGGAPTASSRSESSSWSAGATPRPPAHTTRRSADQVAWSWTSPGSPSSSAAAASGGSGSTAGRGRGDMSMPSIAARRRSRTSVSMARVPLPSPGVAVRWVRRSSVRSTMRSKVTRHAAGSASRSADC